MAAETRDGAPSAQQPPCTLFVSGGTPGAERARSTVLEALAEAGYGERCLEVVDVRRDPQRALKAGAIAVPMLMVRTVHGQRWYAGTFETVREVVPFFDELDNAPA